MTAGLPDREETGSNPGVTSWICLVVTK